MNIEANQEQLETAKADAARTYLSDISKLEKKLQAVQVEYEMAVKRASGLTGIDYSRDRVSTSPSADAIPDAVERYSELKDQMDVLADVVTDAKNERDELIESFDVNDNINAQVIRMRYVLGEKVEDVAFALGYCPRDIQRKQKAGLVELYDAGLPGEYRINYQKAI